jgi:nucleoside-diphosphate-sugar epimerase
LHKISLAESSIEVFGDGSQIRNFVHVVDLCNFLPKVFDIKGKHYFNLRSNILITIGELAKELIIFSGKDLVIKYNTDYMKYEKFRIENFDLNIPLIY